MNNTELPTQPNSTPVPASIAATKPDQPELANPPASCVTSVRGAPHLAIKQAPETEVSLSELTGSQIANIAMENELQAIGDASLDIDILGAYEENIVESEYSCNVNILEDGIVEDQRKLNLRHVERLAKRIRANPGMLQAVILATASLEEIALAKSQNSRIKKFVFHIQDGQHRQAAAKLIAQEQGLKVWTWPVIVGDKEKLNSVTLNLLRKNADVGLGLKDSWVVIFEKLVTVFERNPPGTSSAEFLQDVYTTSDGIGKMEVSHVRAAVQYFHTNTGLVERIIETFLDDNEEYHVSLSSQHNARWWVIIPEQLDALVCWMTDNEIHDFASFRQACELIRTFFEENQIQLNNTKKMPIRWSELTPTIQKHLCEFRQIRYTSSKKKIRKQIKFNEDPNVIAGLVKKLIDRKSATSVAVPLGLGFRVRV